MESTEEASGSSDQLVRSAKNMYLREVVTWSKQAIRSLNAVLAGQKGGHDLVTWSEVVKTGYTSFKRSILCATPGTEPKTLLFARWHKKKPPQGLLKFKKPCKKTICMPPKFIGLYIYRSVHLYKKITQELLKKHS